MPSFDPTNLSGIRKVFTSPTETDQYGYSELALQADVQDAAQLSIEWLCTSVTRDDGAVLNPEIDLDALTAPQIYTLDPSLYTVNATSETVTVTAASVTNSSVTFGGQQYQRGDFQIDGAQPLRIERSTDIDSSLISYQPGSRLSHLTLNASNLQLLFAMQEFTVDLNSISAVAGTIDLSNESIGDIGNVTLDALTADELLIANSSGTFVNKTLAEAGIASSPDLTALTGRVAQNETDIAAIPTDLILTTSSIGDLFDVDSSNADLNDVLKWDGSEWKPGVASVVASLNDLTDVSVTEPDAGDILQYDEATSEFINQTPETNTVTLPFVQGLGSGSTAVNASNFQLINEDFWTWVYTGDTEMLNGVDASSGARNWTCPSSGRYEVSAQAMLQDGTPIDPTELQELQLTLYLNGVSQANPARFKNTLDNQYSLEQITMPGRIVDLSINDTVSWTLSSQTSNGVNLGQVMWQVKRIDFDANLFSGYEGPEPVYYIEGGVQDQTGAGTTTNEATRVYMDNDHFINPMVSTNYGTAQSSHWNLNNGIWTCPADGLYEVYTQFGLSGGTGARVKSYVETDSGSGFSQTGKTFFMRGINPGSGNATQQLYLSSYQVVRQFRQGTELRIVFENQNPPDLNPDSEMDIENVHASIRRIGPYTS